MAKEAKVGLLVGLLFIIGIAIVFGDMSRAGSSGNSVNAGGSNLPSSLSQTENAKNNPSAMMPSAKKNNSRVSRRTKRNFKLDNTNKPTVRTPGHIKTQRSLSTKADSGVKYSVNAPKKQNLVISKASGDSAGTAKVDLGSNQRTSVTKNERNWSVAGRSTGSRFDRNKSDKTIVAKRAKVTPVRKTVAPVSKVKTYIVKSGDRLWDIAEKEYGSGIKYKDIMKYNKLTSTDLKLGQKIKIPNLKAATVTRETTPAKVSSPRIMSNKRTYTVKSGDSLSVIAMNKLGTFRRMNEIQKLNNITGTDIGVGQVLILPAK